MATEDLTRVLDEAGVHCELLLHARTEGAVLHWEDGRTSVFSPRPALCASSSRSAGRPAPSPPTAPRG
jgi:hypothetical protein